MNIEVIIPNFTRDKMPKDFALAAKDIKLAILQAMVKAARLANAILANPYVGDEQHLAVNSQTGLSRTALHIIHFEQLPLLSGIILI